MVTKVWCDKQKTNYCIRSIFDGDFNLAVWQFVKFNVCQY